MEVFKTVKTLQKSLADRPGKSTLGLVPTMGALHEGHLSIVKRAQEENDEIIVSIFVNPTQFDKKEDLDKYPNTLEKDLSLLSNLGCNYVFCPTVEEIYGDNPKTESFDFNGLDQVMEGSFRKGHFDGVATIVKKLFEITGPDQAYFGEKDFQQLRIVQKMVSIAQLEVAIIPCPIFRENDGLAMSSRNVRLTTEQRKAAPLIYKTLSEVSDRAKTTPVSELKSYVDSVFKGSKELELEYFEIADYELLTPVIDREGHRQSRAFIAVFAGSVRLIDNIELN